MATLVGAKPVLWSCDEAVGSGGLRRPWKLYEVAYFPKTSGGLSTCGFFTVASYDAEGNLREYIDLPEAVVEALLEGRVPKSDTEE